MYDAVAEAVPMAQGGQNRKKAIVLISDGNDTNSRLDVARGAATGARNRGAGVRRRHRRQGGADVPGRADAADHATATVADSVSVARAGRQAARPARSRFRRNRRGRAAAAARRRGAWTIA